MQIIIEEDIKIIIIKIIIVKITIAQIKIETKLKLRKGNQMEQ